MDLDLINLFRFLQAGGVQTAPTEDMDAWLFDALSFGQANDITQFYNTAEFSFVFEEYVVEVIGLSNWHPF